MSPQEINQAIAEACGWKGVSPCANSYDDGKHLRGTDPEGEPLRIVPNYYGDLNACREMEKFLVPWQWRMYSDRLMASIEDSDPSLGGSNIEARYRTVHASAPQRCEAFLRTKKKWIE